jgi:hypothetical protein
MARCAARGCQCREVTHLGVMIGRVPVAEDEGLIEDDPARVPTVWLFLPLPHPLGLPEGEALARTADAGDVMRGGGSPTGLDCSLYVHQVERSTNIMLRDNADVLHLVVTKAFRRGVSKEEMFRELDADGVGLNEGSSLTVIEAAIPNCEATHEELTAALDRSIELIQELQTYVALVTGQPVRLISRRTLNPQLCVVTGALYLDGRPPSFEALVPDFMIEDSAPPSVFGLTPEPLTRQELDGVREIGSRRTVAFSLVAEMRREALVAARLDGNPVLGIAAVASAAELLLSTTLLHCTWEERMLPEDAAKLFADRSRSQLKRTIGSLSTRLGGNWSLNGPAEVAEAYEVAQVRNRVVHSGYKPALLDLEEALIVLQDLERFIGDRLCDPVNLRKYPRTALAWSGPGGIKRRGTHSYWLDLLQHDRTEPNWDEAYDRWRRAVDRLLDRHPQPPGARPENCLLYLRKNWTRAGGFTCFVHDRGTGHAAGVSETDAAEPDMLESGKEFLSGLRALYFGERQIMLPWPEGLDLSGLEWVPDYELLEELPLFAGGFTWDKLQRGGF